MDLKHIKFYCKIVPAQISAIFYGSVTVVMGGEKEEEDGYPCCYCHRRRHVCVF